MSYYIDSNKRWGIIGTVVFHIALFLILFMINLKPPYPPRPVIGLEVNLGYSNQGMGNIQPKNVAAEQSQQSKPKTQQSDDNIVNQDIEESINLSDKKTNTKVEPDPKEIEKPVDKKFIFTNKPDSKEGGSEGKTDKAGDQGQSNGIPNSDNYVGGGGDGDVSYNLSGRNKKTLPKPINNSEEQGTVVVKIWVNRDGKVTNARVQVKGTTTSNSNLQNIAIKAALKAVFNSDPNAPEVQTGTITYVYVI